MERARIQTGTRRSGSGRKIGASAGLRANTRSRDTRHGHFLPRINTSVDVTACMHYTVIMIRTQIQLPETEYERLREIAEKERRSMADCIREAIRLFLQQAADTESSLETIAGKFRPQPLEDLKPHDAWFADTARNRETTGRETTGTTE